MTFENLCSLPLTSHLFTQALHPTAPILAVGLAGGHVQSFRLPAPAATTSDEEDADASSISSGRNTIDTEWRTRRHQGSCRTLAYSQDGEALYSSGTDGLVKAASSLTGQVTSKIAIPLTSAGSIDSPSLVHALSPQTLILATDSAALHVYDLRSPNHMASKPAQTYYPHEDYISSLTALPPTASSTSGFSKQWTTTGGTTLAVTDLRKGILMKSDDQEEELLSSVFVGGLPVKPGRTNGEKLVLGDSSGVLTIWERGHWEDQQERIKVVGRPHTGSALESLVLMPEGMGDGGKNIIVGVEDGSIRIVRLGPNKTTSMLQHDEIEGVTALSFDVERRLISGGGMKVKVWQEKMASEEEEEEEGDDTDSSSADEQNEGENNGQNRKSRIKLNKAALTAKVNANGILKLHGLD
ncbi:WD repeat-containing protein [Podosphaera aphanis]|nr:WD repeat-containing protein [Podosphaera aphanis]